MFGELKKVLHIYFFGLYFFYCGIYSIFLFIRLKHGKFEKIKGEIVCNNTIKIKNIHNTRDVKVPVVKFEYNGDIYHSIGYSNTFVSTHNYNPVFTVFVDIYYDEINYPNLVFIDNGFKDYVKGIFFLITGIPFISLVFFILYNSIKNDLDFGFNLGMIEYFLPSLIVLFVLTIMECYVLYKNDILNLNQYSSFTPKLPVDPIEYKNRQRRSLNKKDDRIIIYKHLKEGRKQDAIDYYVKKLGGPRSEAIEIIEEYEKYL